MASSATTTTSTAESSAAAAAPPAAPAPPAPPPGLLAQRFPVNSLQELTLSDGETVAGRVYCTDELTGSIVLQKALVHTTLASEIRIVPVFSVARSAVLSEEDEGGDEAAAAAPPTPLTQPLAKIQKKAMEERERRAIRLAEEQLRHINQKASPVGQAVFDRLLKACGEVVWKGGTSTSILVLHQVQVDAPYRPEDCHIVSSTGKNGLDHGSLDRVKKIVAAAAAASNKDIAAAGGGAGS